jgi:peroxiredoxin family protein
MATVLLVIAVVIAIGVAIFKHKQANTYKEKYGKSEVEFTDFVKKAIELEEKNNKEIDEYAATVKALRTRLIDCETTADTLLKMLEQKKK